MTSVVDLLRRAKGKIGHPNHWTRDFLAVDIAGVPCHVNHPAAARWCVMGALLALSKEGTIKDIEANAACQMLKACLPAPHQLLSLFNDDAARVTHDDVMRLFDRAITLASAQQGGIR